MNLVKIMAGNLLFAGIMWGYYLYVGGNQRAFIDGAVLSLIAFASGTLVGASLSRARQRRYGPRATVVPADDAFDRIS